MGRAPFDELDVMSLGIDDEEEEAVVGAALNLGNLDSLVGQVAAKGGDVVGCEGDVIHAIGGFRIRRGTETDPLRADQVARRLARFNRVGGGEAEDIDVEFSHAFGVGGVERNVIDAGDARTGMGGLRGDRERGEDERDDELFHGGLILDQRGRGG